MVVSENMNKENDDHEGFTSPSGFTEPSWENVMGNSEFTSENIGEAHRRMAQRGIHDQMTAETRDLAPQIRNFIDRSGHLYEPHEVARFEKQLRMLQGGVTTAAEAHELMNRATRGVFQAEVGQGGREAPDFIPPHISDQFRE
jgi:hypothetical protein